MEFVVFFALSATAGATEVEFVPLACRGRSVKRIDSAYVGYVESWYKIPFGWNFAGNGTVPVRNSNINSTTVVSPLSRYKLEI